MEFKKLELSDIEELKTYFTDNPYRICDCTIGGTFMWRDYHKTQFAIEDEVLYLKVDYPIPAFAPPRGANAGKPAYDRIIDYCAQSGTNACICSVSGTTLNYLLRLFPGAKAQTDRSWSDYLYLSGDLINLAGRKFSGQRNHINRFMREHPDWEFAPIDQSNLHEARAYIVKHANEHVKDYPAYTEGNTKAIETLDNWAAYGQSGGVLIAGGKIVGATIGETVGDTLFVHVEKADADCNGAYPVLMSQFAKALATDEVLYINREEDDGVEGLRVSKLSYHPVAILDKYNVEIS